MDEVGEAKAVIVIYVDDILIIGMEDAVKEITALVQGLWAASPLIFLRRDNPLRFLGMGIVFGRGRVNDIGGSTGIH